MILMYRDGITKSIEDKHIQKFKEMGFIEVEAEHKTKSKFDDEEIENETPKRGRNK